MAPLKDLVGNKYGRLTVVSRAENRGSKAAWLCACQCGGYSTTTTTSLNSGKSRSCGCLQREEQSARITKSNTRHGHNRAGAGNQSPTWHSWSSMKKRCNLNSHVSYPSYGGRGISVCSRWSSFENFLEDMGERPPGKTLDRIDVNGNYEPGNCRWATASEQQRNKRPKEKC